MNFKPILIVPGQEKSIFFEIFFKSIKSNKFISPLVLICNKKILEKEIKKYKFYKNIELIDFDKILNNKIKKKIFILLTLKIQAQKIIFMIVLELLFKL